MRNAVAALVAGMLGLLTTLASSLLLVPRVRLVEVLAVVAAAFGSGAALAAAVVRMREARRPPGTSKRPEDVPRRENGEL